MSRFSYPHTINNGAGEQLTFLCPVPGARGDRLLVENVVKAGSGPPMHVHHFQDESLTVTKGRIGYERRGEAPKFAGPGETVFFAAGDVHRFWNAGPDDLECTGFVEPADNLECFLTELYASTRRAGGSQPNPFDAAFLAWRYRSEFDLAVVPAIVQRVVLPVQIALGRLLGRYDRYADAPEPIRRNADTARDRVDAQPNMTPQST